MLGPGSVVSRHCTNILITAAVYLNTQACSQTYKEDSDSSGSPEAKGQLLAADWFCIYRNSDFVAP